MHNGQLEQGMLKQRPMLDATRSNLYQVRAEVHKVKSHFIQSERDLTADVYDLHHIESDAEYLEVIDPVLAEN